jgi:hypothetical protein
VRSQKDSVVGGRKRKVVVKKKKTINIATTCLDVHFWQVLSALVSLECLLLVPKLQECMFPNLKIYQN